LSQPRAAAQVRPAAGGQHLLAFILGGTGMLAPMAQAIYTPAMVEVRDGFGVSNAAAGFTLGIYSLFLVLAQFIYGPLADRLPPRRILRSALGVFLLASLMAFASPTFALFLAARALQALGGASMQVLGPAIIGHVFEPSRRGRALGVFQGATYTGFVLGPVVGSFLSVHAGWRSAFLFLAALAVLAGVGTTWVPATPPRAEPLSARNLAGLVRSTAGRAVFAIGFAQVFTMFGLLSFLPVLLKERMGAGPALVGASLTLLTAGMAFGTPLGGWVVDRRGPRRTLRDGMAGATAATALLAVSTLMPPSVALPVALLAVLGLGLSFSWTFPAPLAVLLAHFGHMRGTAVATYNIIRFCGGTVGPLILGSIVDRFGVAAMPILLPFLLGAAGTWATVALRAPEPRPPA
jgi:DHA1 family bicyclomycin/chloramphenicol resistance-like MFS transporter